MRLRWGVFAVMGVLLVAGLIPTSYMASPRWDVSVVGEDGKPLSGVAVQLVYQNYSAEDQDHEITLTTDENGHVLFPEQSQKSSFARRVFYTLSSARAGVHASFGKHAYVFAFDDKGHEGSAINGKYVTDWQGFPSSMKSRIVLY
jgi:hypothetical protein